MLAALAAGRHILIEGPPGTGKSTVLRTLATAAGVGLEFVEGNAELTPARLIGSHDPSRILDEGYREDNFIDGPLAAALRNGSLLYVEEINRVPEETLNVLITVMSEGELHVPRLGRLIAAPGFGLVAAMNPFDAVGTARISSAVYDRTCRIRMDYQAAEEETRIVQKSVADVQSRMHDVPDWTSADLQMLDDVVALVRSTREHPDIRIGSSVRGAIDMVLVADRLAQVRGSRASEPDVSLDAALAALTGRIRVQEGVERTPEDIITELWHRVFDRREDTAAPPSEEPGKATGAEGRVLLPPHGRD